MTHNPASMNVLVLVNWFSAGHGEAERVVFPYLEHLGVPYTVVDVARDPWPERLADFALLIIGHRLLDPRGRRLSAGQRRAVLEAVDAGTGLVSFDPGFPEVGKRSPAASVENKAAETLEFADEGDEYIPFIRAERPHYITARHAPGEVLDLVSPIRVPSLTFGDAQVLVRAAGQPLVVASRLGQGRVVQWATLGWAHSRVLGPLAGLDDVLWRSLVWAARKPFALRGLAPLVTMRVDDVAGVGELWQQSPFYWTHDANRQGFKPWLGLFIYNLTERAVNELRDLIQRGLATGSPHAFGLLSRPGIEHPHFYDRSLVKRSGNEADEFPRRHGRPPYPADLDEFIFYDHLRGRPWPDDEAQRRLAAVDEWYRVHAPLPMSRCVIPHWGEFGTNTVEHVHERWRADLGEFTMDVDERFALRTPWLRLAPFRLHETPGTAAIDDRRRGKRPEYYADFVNLAGHRFFSCTTVIRDDAGYEWFPDNDVAATVGRGVRQLRRALDSMALAVLFTHETDHLYRIRPDAWAAEVEQTARGIAAYDPIYVTLDDGIRYVRATRTSRLRSCSFHPGGGEVEATFLGSADVPTHFYLFTEEGGEINSRLVQVPSFDGRTVVTAHIPPGGKRGQSL